MDFVCECPGNYETAIAQSTVFQGDAEELLARLPPNFFRCCVTSPPYWGLRDYEIPPSGQGPLGWSVKSNIGTMLA